MAKKVLGTLVMTVDRETRQITVTVRDWEGISPGMLHGMELHIEKAIHEWRLKHTQAAQRKEERAANEALRKQAGDGRVTADQRDAV